jgi:uncharacterized protein YoxC
MSLLKTIQQTEPMREMPEQIETNHEELLGQKALIDHKIKRFERKDIDDRVISSLQKIRDVNDAVSDLQHSLNLVWKRAKQIEEELNEILKPHPTTPSAHSFHSQNPQQ